MSDLEASTNTFSELHEGGAKLIEMHYIQGVPTLWNPDDVHYVQTAYRIIGTFTGPLPRNPRQSSQRGLPLVLMKEEAHLLIEKRFASLVSYPEMLQKAPQDMKKSFEDLRAKCYQEQIESAAQARKEEIICNANQIVQGKLKKLKKQNKDIPPELQFKDKIVEEECKKIKPLPESLSVIQTFIEHPFKDRFEPTSVDWNYPKSKEDKLKYSIFKDLWEKKYYITDGLKFGGDYLVYPYDPLVCHSSYIVKCFFEEDKLNPCDIIAWSRVGTATKKSLVLASVDSEEKVYYLPFTWAGEDISGSHCTSKEES